MQQLSVLADDAAFAGDSRGIKVKTRSVHKIQFGYEEIDLTAVEQLFDTSQTRAIGSALEILAEWVQKPNMKGKSLVDILDILDREVDNKVPNPLSKKVLPGYIARASSCCPEFILRLML